jgi:HAD superfamily hydrolase (TIGR01490 family)
MHATSKKYKNLALFDFDGTLCTKDSFTGFIFYALKKRHIVKQGIKILPWIQAYYLNIYPADSMRIKLFKTMFSDLPAHEIQQFALEYSKVLIEHLNPELHQQLLRHQKNKDHIVIVSASIDLYLKEIAEHLNVDLICTNTEIKNDHFTGMYSTLDCSSEQKRLRVLEKYDLDEYESVYAYGNSKEDLAMFSLANFTYMVGETEHLPKIELQKKLA